LCNYLNAPKERPKVLHFPLYLKTKIPSSETNILSSFFAGIWTMLSDNQAKTMVLGNFYFLLISSFFIHLSVLFFPANHI